MFIALLFYLNGKIYNSIYKHLGHGFCPVASATGRVGYATRVQDWTCVVYPTSPVALATGRKPNPNILMWQAKLEVIYANL